MAEKLITKSFERLFENVSMAAAIISLLQNVYIGLAKAATYAHAAALMVTDPKNGQEYLENMMQTLHALEDQKVTYQEIKDELDGLNEEMPEFETPEFNFDEAFKNFDEFEFDIDLSDDALQEIEDQVNNTNLEFPVDAGFTNLEVEDGVVQLEASTDLQDQVDQAEQLFGSISNILAVQEVAGALLGQAVNNMNGEGAGNGGAGDTITDNSVNNSNNTSVDNVNVYITPDGTLDRDSDATTADSAIDVIKAVAGGL